MIEFYLLKIISRKTAYMRISLYYSVCVMQAWKGPVWKYVVSEVRSSSASAADLSKNLKVLETYITYLQSSREHRELLTRYQGRGERSVEESANLVGLELPKPCSM